MRMIRKLWSWFMSPSHRFGWGLILLAGGMSGVIFWGGFNTFMEYTNTMEFCVSCHEMRDTVYQEYKASPHYKNPSGVRAICSDCHVPRTWSAKLVRKIKASNELYHKLLGSIDTPEKFEAKRLQLAESVWAEMKSNNSRECRNCHDYDAMHFEKQQRRAAEKMREGMEEGKTCIDCHRFIAHKRPEDYEDDD
ncbi:MAG: Denitrification system component NirT [Rhodospirillaceae bacterium]|nr:Denitrification system component NirT [Rhodospirillaceae bacterium]